MLPIIGAERSCVFPLRISRSIAFANRDPSILAGGNAGALVGFLEPRNDAGRLRPVTVGCLIVVWEGTVKWVLSRREPYRNVIAPVRRILSRQNRRNSWSNLCPTSSAGSAPGCSGLAARRSKRLLSQYFSSTDSALLWLRLCAQ